ncbi:hypothetical protein ACFC1W_04455 [Microbacterium sp. NPDC056003]|uniref:hypothetical protein n=1 Tax=Microbacterium sp. NPDC056003 TaxID=3345676 RepID=UPI0035DABFE5
MFRDEAPPPHTCGWSPHYRRTVSNDECARCRAEDELILDTQRVDQKRRARLYRPARAAVVDPPMSEVAIARPGEQSLVRHRQTYVAPAEEVALDSTHLPSIPPHSTD